MSNGDNNLTLTIVLNNAACLDALEAGHRELQAGQQRVETELARLSAVVELLLAKCKQHPTEEEIVPETGVEDEVIQETGRTHGVRPPPVEPGYELEVAVAIEVIVAVASIAVANVAAPNAELQTKLMVGAVLISSRVSSVQGEFGKDFKRKRKHVFGDEWDLKAEQIMVLHDEMLEVLDWKFMHEENNKLLGLYEKPMQERDKATWEGYNGKAKRLSDIALEGKGILEGRENDENLTRTRRSERLRLRKR
ncbi:hypothetical protein ACOSP7_009209 [Xanthoceras sorbifolium]